MGLLLSVSSDSDIVVFTLISDIGIWPASSSSDSSNLFSLFDIAGESIGSAVPKAWNIYLCILKRTRVKQTLAIGQILL